MVEKQSIDFRQRDFSIDETKNVGVARLRRGFLTKYIDAENGMLVFYHY